MTSFKKWIKNLSLKRKFLWILTVNSAFLLLIFTICLTLCTRVYNRLLYNTLAGSLSYSSSTISSNLKNIETLSSLIISDPSLQDHLALMKDTQDVVAHYNADQKINSILFSYFDRFRDQGVTYLAVQNSSSVHCTNWSRYRKENPEFLDEVIRMSAKKGGPAQWVWEPGNRDGLYLTRNIRRIKNFSLDPLGDLFINVDMDAIIDSANHAATQYGDSYYLILDSDDSVIYSSRELEGNDLPSIKELCRNSYGPVPFNGHDYFSVHGTIPDYDWNYINLIPFDSVTGSLKLSYWMIACIMLVGAAFLVFISNAFIRSIVIHFNSLIHKMETFSENELHIPEADYDYDERNDEIGKLHQHFHLTMKRIQTLVNTNYVNEILKRDAQIKALEAQINPHFLYNTLESINWRAKTSGNEKISQMAESLGTLLRATLSNKKSLVTLSYELELVNCYMTIQKLRFEDELEYQLYTDPGLDDAVIPPLTIQPLVENAIHYGMEDMMDLCHIMIYVTRSGGRLIVKVLNDGSVMEDDLLERLENQEIKANGFGIGILNINQRIKLLFGEEYGLSFTNEDGFATAVITIAYRTEV